MQRDQKIKRKAGTGHFEISNEVRNFGSKKGESEVLIFSRMGVVLGTFSMHTKQVYRTGRILFIPCITTL